MVFSEITGFGNYRRCRQLMKSIKVCEYSRSRSFHYDLILQDQASGERSQDQWSSGLIAVITFRWVSSESIYNAVTPIVSPINGYI